MTYSTKTRSNTPPGHYHVRQTLSLWKTDRKQTEDRRQKTEAKPCHALSSSQTTILLLMPLQASIICRFLSSVVDCAVGFNCLEFQSTAPPKVTHSPVVSWSQLERCWFPYAASRSQSWLLLSVSVSELATLLPADVNCHSTNEVEVLIVVSI